METLKFKFKLRELSPYLPSNILIYFLEVIVSYVYNLRPFLLPKVFQACELGAHFETLVREFV